MRKLKLDVDALEVESFVADSAVARRGTVHGQESIRCDGGGFFSLFGTCEGCPSVGTCIGPTYCCEESWRTCNPSCDLSCPVWECGL